MTALTSPRPRICFLTGTLNAMAGAERMTATIASALAKRGYDVSVLCLWDRRSCFPLHDTVTHESLFDERPSFKRAYLSTIAGIRRHVRRQQIDTLILVDTMLTLFTIPALAGLGVRQVAWEHCHFDEDLGRKSRRHARRLAALACAHVVVLTERDRARWTEALAPRHAVICIPNPLPFPMPDEPSPRMDKTVLAVGRLTRAKGFDSLIRAWDKVAKKAPDWNLMIVGEGEERIALEELRRQLSLVDRIALPGVYDDVTQAYRQASVFCLSSAYEGFGLVLIEAMAFGLPIVSTNCETGPKDLLQHGRNAIVVPVDSPTRLAEGILTLIEEHGTADRLAAAGRSDAARYMAPRIVDQWEALLAGSPQARISQRS